MNTDEIRCESREDGKRCCLGAGHQGWHLGHDDSKWIEPEKAGKRFEVSFLICQADYEHQSRAKAVDYVKHLHQNAKITYIGKDMDKRVFVFDVLEFVEIRPCQYLDGKCVHCGQEVSQERQCPARNRQEIQPGDAVYMDSNGGLRRASKCQEFPPSLPLLHSCQICKVSLGIKPQSTAAEVASVCRPCLEKLSLEMGKIEKAVLTELPGIELRGETKEPPKSWRDSPPLL